MARKRGLWPEEAELWARVAKPKRKPAEPEPEPGPAEKPAPARPPIAPFRVGETAKAPKAPKSGVAESMAGEPVRMDRKAYLRLGRGKLVPEAKLDLHGMTLAEAHPALIRFVLAAHAAGRRLVLVVTGKGGGGEAEGPIPAGRGLLRRQVPNWLAQPPLAPHVLQIAEAHRRHGGAGALYVYLRRQPGPKAPRT